MRVVSLCPSITDTVFALGRGDTLVGRSRFCIRPAPAVTRIERVGGTKNPKLARIVELAPDLVLMNQEENRREDAEALTAAGLRVLSSLPRDVPETVRALHELAAALDAKAAGERLAAEIEAAQQRAHGAAAGRPRRRFAYLIWREPFMLAGRGTYIDALLSAAGGQNIAAEADGRYPERSAADLAAAAPDRVFLSSEPFPFTASSRPSEPQ
jgi:ABC-type Fe3+-hydroxamate transport system substrate-binding protein